jgi:hypothetical protein
VVLDVNPCVAGYDTSDVPELKKTPPMFVLTIRMPFLNWAFIVILRSSDTRAKRAIFRCIRIDLSEGPQGLPWRFLRRVETNIAVRGKPAISKFFFGKTRNELNFFPLPLKKVGEKENSLYF